MSRSGKKTVIICAVAAVVTAAAALIVYFGFYMLPYARAENSMSVDTSFELALMDDGSTRVRWTEGENCDGYTVELTRRGASQPDMLLSVYDAECNIPAGETAGEIIISVNSWKSFSRLGRSDKRAGAAPALLRCDLSAPEISDFTISPDPDANTALLSWQCGTGDTARVYIQNDGSQQSLGDFSGGRLLVNFGSGKELAMPDYGETYTFYADIYRQGENYIYHGNSSNTAALIRDDLLGTQLHLKLSENGNNSYTLSWDETKGDGYIVQRRSAVSDGWETVHMTEHTGEQVYETGHLEPFKDYELRVAATSAQSDEFAAGPEELRITTAESCIYASVWPLMELEIYSDAGKQNSVGQVPAAACCCVIAEEGDMFLVRYGGLTGYIESDYCLINLPDFIGGLCSYDIANSYSAVYMVHEFEIPAVTDTVVAGYENIELREGEYLVPLLYPVAKKLAVAAQTTLADGYRIKIYDAYRPNRATRSIYDLTLSIIDEPIPDEPFTDKKTLEELRLPEPAEEMEYVSYYQLVTNGIYSLGNFLASRGSYHNMGIAVDMTLEWADSGDELNMQTSMHDLSWYSAVSENNANANILAAYMRNAGFGGLTSEWWHFQDNDTKDRLKLNTFMWSGVGPEGWKADDRGWRYRNSAGVYCIGCTRNIGGVDFSFDSSGYLIEE